MRTELQRRVALSLFGLAVAVSAVVSGMLWFAHAWMEQAVLASILEREAAGLLARPDTAGQITTTSQGISLYIESPAQSESPGGALPEALQRLQPGSYRDVHMDDREFHVLVGTRSDGRHYYLAYDVTRFARRERWLVAAFVGALALAAIFSLVAGRLIAQRLLAPVNSLIGRIRALDRDRLTPLSIEPDDRQFAGVVDAINGLVGEVRQRVERERAFASAAGHELRTPLTSIRIAAETIRATDDADRERLRRVQRAVATAGATLDTLLMAARGAESPARALALKDELPAWAEPWLGDSRAQIVWHLADVHAILPAAALATIFTNLLRNALKAAPEGHVTVTLEPGRLQVRDDGDGIDPALLQHVFEPATHSRSGGSGIGLYLSHMLARRHGWSLEVRNDRPSGVIAELDFGSPHS